MPPKICIATNRAGQPCSAHALRNDQYCYFHSPRKAADRLQNSKKGGYARATPHAGDISKIVKEPRTVEDVYTILDYSMAESLALKNSTVRNRLLIDLAKAYLQAISVGAFEERLESLEQIIGQNGRQPAYSFN